MPLRGALPTLTLFAMLPSVSIRPQAWLAAMPSAQVVRSASRRSSLATAAAAPITPQVLVMCQPRA